MATLIPYTLFKKFDYDPKPAWGIGVQGVFFRCECGALTELDNWHIAEDGKVTPSVHHIDCGFHQNIVLADYDQHM
jgi:hypothetical protein